MRFVALVTALLISVVPECFGQWTRTTFADTIGINTIVTKDSLVFVGVGGPIPIPVLVSGNEVAENPAVPLAADAGGMEGKGVFVSSDSGADWMPVGLQETTVLSMTDLGGNLYAGTQFNGVYMSTDNGAHWTAADSGLGNKGVVCFAEGPESTGGMNLYAGTYGSYMYVSHDSGAAWTRCDSNMFGSTVTAIAAQGPYVFAATMLIGPVSWVGMVIYRSTDYGNTWEISDSLTHASPPVNAILVHENDVLAGTYHGLYISTDDGSNWAFEDSSESFNCFDTANGEIFAGTSLGPYRSVDGGETWVPVGTGLKDSTMVGLLAGTPTTMFLGTGSYFNHAPAAIVGPPGIIWTRPVSELTSVNAPGPPVPAGFSLSQNYPNPFNPTTVIRFEVRSSRFVSLKVYNVLGQLVKTLVDKVESPGSHEVTFNGAGLSSGVYFYRLDAGSYSKTMKLMLLK